ncbi:MAG: hypothetical protein AB1650_02925 [Candidatus Omnitrophota bacterium]
MEFLNTDKLHSDVKLLFLPFLQKLITEDKDKIISAWVYGSAASAAYVPGVSDINSVLVVSAINQDFLDRRLKIIRAAGRKRIEAPLILTEDHIRSSSDVFPIEFLEMKQHHVLLYGKDILKDLVVEEEHIRLFCEQQIKGKLIRIRQAYLEVGLKRKGIESLLRESLGSLLPVFRNLLRLRGIEVPIEKEAVLARLGEEFDLDPGMMIFIWKDQKKAHHVTRVYPRDVFDDYIQQLEKLARAVDQL